MDETFLVEKIMQFGLTRQETLIYLCLLTSKELSGYEVAKQTGISRSNVYSSLNGLVDKGAAYLLEGSTNKYVAVELEDFCNNKLRSMAEMKEELLRCFPIHEHVTEGYITISGYKHILDKVYTMISHTQERIYLAAPGSFIKKFKTEIEKLCERNIKIVLITDEDPKIAGSIWYLSEQREQQIRFIVDSEYVLTGEISGELSDSCLYCAQKNFVNVFKESLRNEIKLIKLTGGHNTNE